MHYTDDHDDETATVPDGAPRCARASGCREWERTGQNGSIDKATGLCAECVVDVGLRAIDCALAGDKLTDPEVDAADAVRHMFENLPVTVLAEMMAAHWQRSKQIAERLAARLAVRS